MSAHFHMHATTKGTLLSPTGRGGGDNMDEADKDHELHVLCYMYEHVHIILAKLLCRELCSRYKSRNNFKVCVYLKSLQG